MVTNTQRLNGDIQTTLKKYCELRRGSEANERASKLTQEPMARSKECSGTALVLGKKYEFDSHLVSAKLSKNLGNPYGVHNTKQIVQRCTAFLAGM